MSESRTSGGEGKGWVGYNHRKFQLLTRPWKNSPKFKYHHVEPMTITNSSSQYKTESESEDIHCHNCELRYDVERKMNYELDFTQRTEQWTHGKGKGKG